MITPYDWQEGIGHRAQYVEAKLAQGMPVLAMSIADGILMYTQRRQARKLYEIYDRLAFGAIGQQSDVETLRVAAIEFAHHEGFNRSEQDVTLQRVVTALSQPVKRAFADFTSPPVIAKCLFAEVGDNATTDQYSLLDFDGDFRTRAQWAFIAGDDQVRDALHDRFTATKTSGMTLKKARQTLEKMWDECVPESMRPSGLFAEVVLLERCGTRVNRFRTIEGGQFVTDD